MVLTVAGTYTYTVCSRGEVPLGISTGRHWIEMGFSGGDRGNTVQNKKKYTQY